MRAWHRRPCRDPSIVYDFRYIRKSEGAHDDKPRDGCRDRARPALAAFPRPGKIIAIHLSYASRAAQRGRAPTQPRYFFKPSSSVAASGGSIERPAGTELLAFEGEIALVIGSPARRVTLDDAWSHVGVGHRRRTTSASTTCARTTRARTCGRRAATASRRSARRSSMRAAVDPAGLRLRTWVNGELAPGGHDGRPAVPARPARRRPLAALHARARRRDPHGHPRRFVGRRAGRRRRGRGRCPARSG